MERRGRCAWVRAKDHVLYCSSGGPEPPDKRERTNHCSPDTWVGNRPPNQVGSGLPCQPSSGQNSFETSVVRAKSAFMVVHSGDAPSVIESQYDLACDQRQYPLCVRTEQGYTRKGMQWWPDSRAEEMDRGLNSWTREMAIRTCDWPPNCSA
ncbi:hypothetical protein DAEQUDRAFT_267154 [Daedalea quercina L-15889]|uniref:Uncharacterized protein n=1 Tax=Daedalea quercina L-15889 TaxID=1314783 RepID=A0A165QGZ4_9APHY|nr:hypothetical protein DAEQUDRAFT_267154 [Daedalea quercina L-15889]